MSSSEHILSLPSWDFPVARKPKGPHPGGAELSVFDIPNTFHCCWFLSRASLVANVTSAQKAEDRNFSWVEFAPQYHSHLVKCTVALVPHPVQAVKKVIFVYILELLNRVGSLAFFDLRKGGHKANNAQKENKCLAHKWCHAAKCKQEREAAKVAKRPQRERQCEGCGHKFASRKTSHKHKCTVNKGESVRKEATAVPATQVVPSVQLIKPAATITPHAPPPPPNSNPRPVVTGDLQELDRALHSDTSFDLISPNGNRLIMIDPRSDVTRACSLWRDGWRFSGQ
jgi:hypothetical protein